MENPFRYGDVATGFYFTDRAAELAELVADIRSGQNVVIISPRRYGKTSLVFRAVEQLQPDRVLIAYLDLFRAPTRDRFADQLAAAIYNGLVAPLGRVWHRALDVFRRLPMQPRVTVNSDGSFSVEFGAIQHPRDLDRVIEGLLAMPGQVAAEREVRVALIIDEFQEIVSIDPHLPALMRSVFQLQSEVAHIFLGSKRHLMQRVFTDEREPLYKLAKPLTLRAIAHDDFAAFIHARFAATGVSIIEAAVHSILAITGGHPHDTQELCYFTWAIAQAERAAATAALVERALEQVLEAEDAHYTILWEELSPNQRLLLTALVESGDEPYSEEYRRRHRLGAPSTVQRSLARLLERELVEFHPPSTYRIPDVFLRPWIARLSAPRRPPGHLSPAEGPADEC